MNERPKTEEHEWEIKKDERDQVHHDSSKQISEQHFIIL